MQAAIYIREKQRLRRKSNFNRRGRLELPSHVATREIAPFPQYPPHNWGKAAWQDRERDRAGVGSGPGGERRPSACEAGINHRVKSTEARRRWMRRNRIHDTAYGGSSSDEDDVPFPFGHESAAANALLYVGLGTVAVGMVIAFVGTGEKGFKTLELRLIGPTLIAGGVLCCLLRVMLCVCPSKCLLRRFRQRNRHKKQVLALEAAGRIAMGPMGRSVPHRHSVQHHGMRASRTLSRTSRPGSRTSRPGSRTGSRPPSRLSRAPSELIRSPSDPNDPTVSGGARGKKRVSIASGGPGGPGGPGTPLSEQPAASKTLGFTVPTISLPTRGRATSEDYGEGYMSGVRSLQSCRRLGSASGSTGDLPLLAAVDLDGDADGPEAYEMGSCSFNSAFSPDDARPGPSTAPSTSHVHAPHAIIVTSPTPSSSPRPAARSAGSAGSGASSSHGDRDRPTREIILSPGGLGLQ